MPKVSFMTKPLYSKFKTLCDQWHSLLKTLIQWKPLEASLDVSLEASHRWKPAWDGMSLYLHVVHPGCLGPGRGN